VEEEASESYSFSVAAVEGISDMVESPLRSGRLGRGGREATGVAEVEVLGRELVGAGGGFDVFPV